MLTAALCLSLLLTGCGSQNKTTISAESTTVNAIVAERSGNVITVNVMNTDASRGRGGFFGGNFPDGDFSGSRPEMPAGGFDRNNMPDFGSDFSGDFPGGERPDFGSDFSGGFPGGERPDFGSDFSGEFPGGQMPDFGNFSGDFSDFSGAGETETVTINDDSVLFESSNNTEKPTTIDRISAGQTMSITFDANGKITKILVSNRAVSSQGTSLPYTDGSTSPADWDA